MARLIFFGHMVSTSIQGLSLSDELLVMPKVLASPGASSMPRTAAAKVTPWHPFWAAEGRFGPIAAFSDLRRAVIAWDRPSGSGSAEGPPVAWLPQKPPVVTRPRTVPTRRMRIQCPIRRFLDRVCRYPRASFRARARARLKSRKWYLSGRLEDRARRLGGAFWVVFGARGREGGRGRRRGRRGRFAGFRGGFGSSIGLDHR